MVYSEAVDIFKKYGVKNISFLADKELKLEYHRLARKYHSDVGGNDSDIADINLAYKTIVEERGKISASLYDTESIETKPSATEVTSWIFNGSSFTGYYKYMQKYGYKPCFNSSTEYLLNQEKKNGNKVEAIIETLSQSKLFYVVYIAGTSRRFTFSGATLNPENDKRFTKYLKQEVKSIKSENGFSLSKWLFT